MLLRLIKASMPKARVEIRPFRTTVTYLVETFWGLGALILGLILPLPPWLRLAWIVPVWGLLLHYFDWRISPLSRLPPQRDSSNVVVTLPRDKAVPPNYKVVLMAHRDSAPVSLVYHPLLVSTFMLHYLTGCR